MRPLEQVTKGLVCVGFVLTLHGGFSIGVCVGSLHPNALTNSTALVLIAGAVGLSWLGFKILDAVSK